MNFAHAGSVRFSGYRERVWDDIIVRGMTMRITFRAMPPGNNTTAPGSPRTNSVTNPQTVTFDSPEAALASPLVSLEDKAEIRNFIIPKLAEFKSGLKALSMKKASSAEVNKYIEKWQRIDSRIQISSTK